MLNKTTHCEKNRDKKITVEDRPVVVLSLRALPLPVHALAKFGSNSIALSYFMASSYLFNLSRTTPWFTQVTAFLGSNSTALT
jgi:hypothetical protein